MSVMQASGGCACWCMITSKHQAELASKVFKWLGSHVYVYISGVRQLEGPGQLLQRL